MLSNPIVRLEIGIGVNLFGALRFSETESAWGPSVCEIRGESVNPPIQTLTCMVRDASTEYGPCMTSSLVSRFVALLAKFPDPLSP